MTGNIASMDKATSEVINAISVMTRLPGALDGDSADGAVAASWF